MIAIHTSDRKTFKDCRRKWDLSSRIRQNLAPKKVNDKLWLGSGVHYSLEHYYGNDEGLISSFNDWADQEVMRMKEEQNGLWQEQQDMLKEQRELGIGILEHYKKFAKKEDPKYFEKVIETEVSFEVPIYNNKGNRTHGVYRGTYDGIVQDSDGFYWLLEHKTASRISTDHLPLDEQVVSYMWAAQQEYGIELEGVIYNILLKKIPTKPRELKSGGLSKAKNIKTTYNVYVNALKEHYNGSENVPWEEYESILDHLKDKDNEFFWRKKLTKTQEEINDIGRRIYQEYKDMTDPNLSIYPRPSRDCIWKCDFREVCIAMNQGADYQYMLDTMYEKNF